uniref:Ion transport domain-containing protein n=1 Tax=Ciona savignyi TaxID=51511 RepID=H2YFM2_CIOSA
WFERVSMLVILLNCVPLGLYQPCQPKPGLPCGSPRCSILEICDHFVFAFFAIEMLIKMLAMGVWGKLGYLGEAWNRLDFFIVLCGMMEYTLQLEDTMNFTSVRTVRVLRPLRAINRVPNMRILVMLLLDTLPMLGNVLMLCSFVFFIFGVVAVQLWEGTLRQRCFLDPNINLGNPLTPIFHSSLEIAPFYSRGEEDLAICSLPMDSGEFHCSDRSIITPFTVENITCSLNVTHYQVGKPVNHLYTGTPMCIDWNQYMNTCKAGDSNPSLGSINFDNIMYAWVAIFQVISLEGWVDIMYYLMDGYSFYSFIYFILLIVIGSFFMINLCLVVIATQFSETKQREQRLMEEQRLRFKSNDSTLASYSPPGNCYEEMLKYISHLYRKNKRKIKSNIICAMLYTYVSFQRRWHKWQTEKKLKRSGMGSLKREVPVRSVRKKKKSIHLHHHHHHHHHHYHIADTIDRTGDGASVDQQLQGSTAEKERFSFLRDFQEQTKRVVDSSYFNRGIMIAILINTLSMGIEHHSQPDGLTEVLEISNVIFTTLFALEMIAKIVAFGVAGYTKNLYNVFDALIVIIRFVLRTQNSGGGLSVLRTFRLLRVLKLVRFMPALQRQLVVLMKTMDNVATFMMLLTLFIFIFSILGMHLFGCDFCWVNQYGRTECDRKNFDSLLWAFVTVFQILTQEDWNIVLYNGMAATSPFASIYFITLMTIGNYVLFSLLVAILVEGFQAEDGDDEVDDYVETSSDEDEEVELLTRGRCPLIKVSTSKVFKHGFIPLDELSVRFSLSNHPSDTLRLLCRHFIFSHKNQEKESENWSLPVITRTSATPLHTPTLANISQENSLEKSFLSAESRGSSTDSQTEKDANHNTPQSVKKHAILSRKPSTEVRLFAVMLGPPNWTYTRKEWSLYLFSPELKFRRAVQKITEHKVFDNTILLLIFGNCITIAMERPSLKEGDYEREVLDCFNNIFTFVFLLELILKVIASGFYVGPKAYLKSGWNVLDFFLVSTSLIDFIMTLAYSSGSKLLGMLRVFRLLRALRPLRVISRAPGLKLVVQTLISSLKPIGNIVLICCAFFIIFGILGVQVLKGKFYRCVGPDLRNVTNKSNCLANPNNNWVNRSRYFRTNGQYLSSKYEGVCSNKCWLATNHWGATDLNTSIVAVASSTEQWLLVLLVLLVLLSGFFNDIHYVVILQIKTKIQNIQEYRRRKQERLDYKKSMRHARGEQRLNFRRKTLSRAKNQVTGFRGHCFSNSLSSFADNTKYYEEYGPARRALHDVCMNKYFEIGISIVIGINILTMAAEHYKQPKVLDQALKIANYFFTAVFILEAVLKLIALGFRRYFRDRWNQVDMLIVILSVVGIAVEALMTSGDERSLLINPTIIRVMRVLRIARVLKLLKVSKGIRSLLETVGNALPQVGNLGLLFLLLFFIFAALGVELFGTLSCDEAHPCNGLSRHASFSNFGIALLTLFRISTGDNWNGIMKDTIRQECDASDSCMVNCCSSSIISPIYFVLFVMTAQFVLVNVVVAVLMK